MLACEWLIVVLFVVVVKQLLGKTMSLSCECFIVVWQLLWQNHSPLSVRCAMGNVGKIIRNDFFERIPSDTTQLGPSLHC